MAANPIDWPLIRAVREVVARELERLRAADQVGSSLGAEVDLYCDKTLATALDALGDELRFVLITSGVRVLPLDDAPSGAAGDPELAGLRVVVRASQHPKCVRCWHHRGDVGDNDEHPELCGRCVGNIAGAGEQRQYA